MISCFTKPIIDHEILADSQHYDVYISLQCARLNSTVYIFTALDTDHGRNAELHYSVRLIESNSTVDGFWIDPATGVLKTKAKFTSRGGEKFRVCSYIFYLKD